MFARGIQILPRRRSWKNHGCGKQRCSTGESSQKRVSAFNYCQNSRRGTAPKVGEIDAKPRSSAGAGSGEFHVYRHLRRREYQRQDFLERLSEKQKLDEEYKEKLIENQKAAEDRTAKRRKKREKLKQKKLMAKKAKMESQKEEDSEKSSSSSASEGEEKDDDAEVPSFIMGKR